MITRLGLSATTRSLYGSFSGKTASEASEELTRLGLSGTPRSLYGSFSGKVEAEEADYSILTRLGLAGFSRGLYGDFSGKTLQLVTTGGGSSKKPKQKNFYLMALREDRELLEIITALTTSDLL